MTTQAKELRKLADELWGRGYKEVSDQVHRMARDAKEREKWESQDKPCSGPGFSHKAHGACPGYTYDRT